MLATWLAGGSQADLRLTWAQHTNLYWDIQKGSPSEEAIVRYVLKSIEQKHGWDKVRPLAGGLTFADYKDRAPEPGS